MATGIPKLEVYDSAQGFNSRFFTRVNADFVKLCI